jgi:clan AA aspartic protease
MATTTAVPEQKGRERRMGKVVTEVTIVNRLDQGLAERGVIRPDQVRSIELHNVLVDTGATTLALPRQIVEALGLHLLEEIPVGTAAGVRRLELYEDAKITVMGRTGTFECLAIDDASDALLGVISLERLGLELDLQGQQLILLPERGDKTYWLAPSPVMR